jgi:hypothetical protein
MVANRERMEANAAQAKWTSKLAKQRGLRWRKKTKAKHEVAKEKKKKDPMAVYGRMPLPVRYVMCVSVYLTMGVCV